MRSSVVAATGFLSGVVLSLFACSSDETTDTSSTGNGASASTSTSTSASTGGGGSSSASTASAGGTGGSTGGAGGTGGTGGMGTQSGDCDTDADCPGQTCVEVTPGGFKSCTSMPPTSNGCVPPCEAPAQCYPEYGYCGGIVGPMDTCYADQCTMDSECIGGVPAICVKAGVLGHPVNMCMPAACKHDADCNAQPGGICAPVDSACCGIVEALYCVYPNEGCRHETDCPGGYCANDGTKSFCMPGAPPCPE